MIEEPYRWVDAIANRREYIEHQLSTGSPIVAVSYSEGILLFALGRERQKIFEIYDRIAMGGVGHPGDIERFRMAAIELASTEGFTRSAHDVSLRRLVNYSLSPVLKAAFEQIYGAPHLARMIFAELGRGSVSDLFVVLDYDGSIRTNGGPFGHPFQDFGCVSGTAHSSELMQRFLSQNPTAGLCKDEALVIASQAWSVGHLALADPDRTELPPVDEITRHGREQLALTAIEAGVLERAAPTPVTWSAIPDAAIRPLLDSR